MKKKHHYTRRRFLELSSKALITLPLVSAIGCDLDNSPILSSEESLKKLIFLIGPWSKSEKQIAENFVKRFIKFNHTESYLPGSSKLVQSLANRYSLETMAINEINMKNLPSEERELLIILTQQLYSFVEVRYYVAKEPPWGQCQGNQWHTRAPIQT